MVTFQQYGSMQAPERDYQTSISNLSKPTASFGGPQQNSLNMLGNQAYRSFDNNFNFKGSSHEQLEDELTGRLTAPNDSDGEPEFGLGDLGH